MQTFQLLKIFSILSIFNKLKYHQKCILSVKTNKSDSRGITFHFFIFLFFKLLKKTLDKSEETTLKAV